MINLNQIPPVTKNLLILNIVVFVLQNTIPWFNEELTLRYFQNPEFQPYQLITHMFMHGDIRHLFFNMFGIYMFGSAIEMRLGDKRFLTYYLLTGFGAVILHSAVEYFEIYQITHTEGLLSQVEISELQQRYGSIFYGGVLGASGALFGLLAAFALLFPNQPIFLMFIPVPIKAKYFVGMYAAYELFRGVQNTQGDNIAHFAHLGGALFGWLIIREWRKKHLI